MVVGRKRGVKERVSGRGECSFRRQPELDHRLPGGNLLFVDKCKITFRYLVSMRNHSSFAQKKTFILLLGR